MGHRAGAGAHRGRSHRSLLGSRSETPDGAAERSSGRAVWRGSGTPRSMRSWPRRRAGSLAVGARPPHRVTPRWPVRRRALAGVSAAAAEARTPAEPQSWGPRTRRGGAGQSPGAAPAAGRARSRRGPFAAGRAPAASENAQPASGRKTAARPPSSWTMSPSAPSVATSKSSRSRSSSSSSASSSGSSASSSASAKRRVSPSAV